MADVFQIEEELEWLQHKFRELCADLADNLIQSYEREQAGVVVYRRNPDKEPKKVGFIEERWLRYRRDDQKALKRIERAVKTACEEAREDSQS